MYVICYVHLSIFSFFNFFPCPFFSIFFSNRQLFQRVFTCKNRRRYSRERAPRSLGENSIHYSLHSLTFTAPVLLSQLPKRIPSKCVRRLATMARIRSSRATTSFAHLFRKFFSSLGLNRSPNVTKENDQFTLARLAEIPQPKSRRSRGWARPSPPGSSGARLRRQMNNELNFPPNFEGLVLGCIDASKQASK